MTKFLMPNSLSKVTFSPIFLNIYNYTKRNRIHDFSFPLYCSILLVFGINNASFPTSVMFRMLNKSRSHMLQFSPRTSLIPLLTAKLNQKSVRSPRVQRVMMRSCNFAIGKQFGRVIRTSYFCYLAKSPLDCTVLCDLCWYLTTFFAQFQPKIFICHLLSK